MDILSEETNPLFPPFLPPFSLGVIIKVNICSSRSKFFKSRHYFKERHHPEMKIGIHASQYNHMLEKRQEAFIRAGAFIRIITVTEILFNP